MAVAQCGGVSGGDGGDGMLGAVLALGVVTAAALETLHLIV